MKVEVCAISPLAAPLCDAILISSNQRMQMSGGLSGAIHRMAGPMLRAHCYNLRPLSVGSAIVTPGFDSPFRWIVHAHPGNNFTHETPWRCLAQTLLAALRAADSDNINSLCTMAFGTGSAQIPVIAAAAIMMQVLGEDTASLKNLELFKVCIPDAAFYETYLGAARIRNLAMHSY